MTAQMSTMHDRLGAIEGRFEELERLMGEPGTAAAASAVSQRRSPVGSSSGTATAATTDNIYAGSSTVTNSIVTVSGGNFENLIASGTAVSTAVTDEPSADVTTLSLSAIVLLALLGGALFWYRGDSFAQVRRATPRATLPGGSPRPIISTISTSTRSKPCWSASDSAPSNASPASPWKLSC